MAKWDAIGRGWWIGWFTCTALLACHAQSPVSMTTPHPPPSKEIHSLAPGHTAGPAHRRRASTSAESHGIEVPAALTKEMQPNLVSLQNGKLTIHANDSDLAKILESLSTLTGMTVKGSVFTDHIFGVYGPGAPRDVLAQLLTGSPYDFVMAGVIAEGLPRELVLNVQDHKTGIPADQESQISTSSNSAGQSAVPSGTEINFGTENSLAQQAEAANTEPLGPGAIAHVPPNEAGGQGNPQDDRMRVQQSLQKLQHIQEQQGAPQ